MRVRNRMRRAYEFARSGDLSDRAALALDANGRPQARREQLRRTGSELGSRRAASYREQRERRARRLGFEGVDDMLRRRYVEGGARIEDVVADLGASWSAVRADMQRAGIVVRRGWRRPS